MKKQVSVVHLVYLIIVAVLVIMFTLVFAFGGNPDAGNQVNVMATGVSIILAVIAILMTLVDVAGQRQSMIDLKETAESLTESNKIAQEMIQKALETYESLSETKEVLLETVSEYKRETIEVIREIKKGDQKDAEKLNRLLEELESKNIVFDNRVSTIKKEVTDKSGILAMFTVFHRWFLKNYEDIEKEKEEDFLNKLDAVFGYNNRKLLMNYLYRQGFIGRDDEWIIFSKKLKDRKYMYVTDIK
ncbi:hypothetical protein P9E03_16070 [Bacillus mojavensis]|uniref:hypothetical protein n=1 Tax=Bacillus mojavensis TaxID=72360 RepID=UPI002DBDDDA9|nr:hypothetical protein [Bacillus mojavensis]MEC1800561.1 hypothetical protein [Bacillus mojavensis]